MPEIDPVTVGLHPEFEREFWVTLRSALEDVLKAEGRLLDRFKANLASASPYERLLVLHDDPLDVAAALADISLTTEHLRRYDELRARWESDLSPAEQPITNDPVSLEQLAAFLNGLGYFRMPDSNDAYLTWQLMERPEQDERLWGPQRITTMLPNFRTPTGRQMVYDRSYVTSLFLSILIQRHETSDELTKMLQILIRPKY